MFKSGLRRRKTDAADEEQKVFTRDVLEMLKDAHRRADLQKSERCCV